MNNKNAEVLEQLIDQTSLASVLTLLSVIAHEKAEHIRSNWQDPTTAQSWSLAADSIEKLSHRVRTRLDL